MESSTNSLRVRCNMDSSLRQRRLSEEAIRSERGEMRGVFILVVCGLYALSMFLLAKLLSGLLGSLTTSVLSLFTITKEELKMAAPAAVPKVQQTHIAPFMRSSIQSRPVYHG